MHIPKTAGTSIIHGFTELVGDNCAENHLSGRRSEWSGFQLKRFNSGHLFFSECQELLSYQSSALVTVFRDPVERLVSHICYQDSFSQAFFSDIYRGWPQHIKDTTDRLRSVDFQSAYSLNDFLSDLSPWETLTFDNAQVRYLIDDPGEDLSNFKKSLSDADADFAIRRLNRFQVIGTCDNLQNFMADAARHGKLPTPRPVKWLNKSRRGRSINLADPEILAVFKSKTYLDQKLFDAVKRRLTDPQFEQSCELSNAEHYPPEPQA